jgi:hypothetical protein
MDAVYNHHGYAWRENHNGRDLWLSARARHRHFRRVIRHRMSRLIGFTGSLSDGL